MEFLASSWLIHMISHTEVLLNVKIFNFISFRYLKRKHDFFLQTVQKSNSKLKILEFKVTPKFRRMTVHVDYICLEVWVNFVGTSHSAKQTVSAPSVPVPNRQSYSILINRQSELQMRSQIQLQIILHAEQGHGQQPLQALANQRSYMNLERL
jgi:hypothetical protein